MFSSRKELIFKGKIPLTYKRHVPAILGQSCCLGIQIPEIIIIYFETSALGIKDGWRRSKSWQEAETQLIQERDVPFDVSRLGDNASSTVLTDFALTPVHPTLLCMPSHAEVHESHWQNGHETSLTWWLTTLSWRVISPSSSPWLGVMASKERHLTHPSLSEHVGELRWPSFVKMSCQVMPF